MMHLITLMMQEVTKTGANKLALNMVKVVLKNLNFDDSLLTYFLLTKDPNLNNSIMIGMKE
jgi:hypothetical protein